MHIVRTIIWVLLLVGLVFFSYLNWTDIKVTLWPNVDPARNLVADTKLPVVVIVSFLIGFLPMWLYHRGSKWAMQRKIASLENAARTAAATPVVATPAPDPKPEPAPEPAPVAAPKSDPALEPETPIELKPPEA